MLLIVLLWLHLLARFLSLAARRRLWRHPHPFGYHGLPAYAATLLALRRQTRLGEKGAHPPESPASRRRLPCTLGHLQPALRRKAAHHRGQDLRLGAASQASL